MDIFSTLDIFIGVMKPDDIAELTAMQLSGKEHKYSELLTKVLSRIICNRDGIDISNAGYIEHQIKCKVDYLVKDLKEKEINP